jgi:ElaB/YqjD/DUF883 family membrane-anchored ribosome-binding protein
MSEAANTSTDRKLAGSGTSEGSGGSESVPEQAVEKVQEGAVVVQEKALELKANAGGRVRQELDTRSSEAGSQLREAAAAMRRTTELLRQEGKDGPAKAMELVAERADRLGSYLTAANSSQLLGEVEAFARRRPWVAAAGGAAVGFFASRSLKASSSARYQRSTATPSPRQTWQPPAPAGNPSSRATEAFAPEHAGNESDEAAMLTSPRGSSNG